MDHVIVITGAGGCGLAIARRLACGRKIIIGSRSQKSRDFAKTTLTSEGHKVEVHPLDVTSKESVESFAQTASKAGTINTIIHTSGVSPATSTGSVDEVLQINLFGTCYIIDAFLPLIPSGASLIHLSSIAGHMAPPIPFTLQHHLATSPTTSILDHPEWSALNIQDVHNAYAHAKQATTLRVQGYAKAYGDRGARINSVSPAIVLTPMGHAEVKANADMDLMLQGTALKRYGTPEDVAAAVSFLAGRESSWITGTDLILDGGAMCLIRWGFPPQEMEGEKGKWAAMARA